MWHNAEVGKSSQHVLVLKVYQAYIGQVSDEPCKTSNQQQVGCGVVPVPLPDALSPYQACSERHTPPFTE